MRHNAPMNIKSLFVRRGSTRRTGIFAINRSSSSFRYIFGPRCESASEAKDPLPNTLFKSTPPRTPLDHLDICIQTSQQRKPSRAAPHKKKMTGPRAKAEDEQLIPPENFSMVEGGLYRSGFPKKKNFPFLKALGIKSILTLVLEEYPATHQEFNAQNGIQLLQFGVPGNKV